MGATPRSFVPPKLRTVRKSGASRKSSEQVLVHCTKLWMLLDWPVNGTPGQGESLAMR